MSEMINKRQQYQIAYAINGSSEPICTVSRISFFEIVLTNLNLTYRIDSGGSGKKLFIKNNLLGTVPLKGNKLDGI